MDLWKSDIQKVESAKYCSWLQQLLVNHLSLHAFIGSFILSIIPVPPTGCSHKIWCTHHSQMSLQLPGESISFTNISDRGRKFQRSWQTMQFIQIFSGGCKNGHLFLQVCLYTLCCQWYCYNYWLCFGRNGKSTSIQTQDWIYPVLTSSKKTPWLPMTFPDRKELVVEWKNERGSFRSSTRMAAMRKRCRDMPRVSLMWPSSCDPPKRFAVNFPSQQTARVFFLLVQGCDEKLKTIEANWEKSDK